MSEGSVTFAVTADTSEAFAEVAAFQAKIDQVAHEWSIKKRKIIRDARKILRMTNALMNLYRSVMRAMGYAIGAVGEAVLMAIQNTVMVASAVMAVATAEAAIGNWLALIVSSFALGFSISAVFAVQAGVENARLESSKAIDVMQSLTGVLYASGI